MKINHIWVSQKSFQNMIQILKKTLDNISLQYIKNTRKMIQKERSNQVILFLQNDKEYNIECMFITNMLIRQTNL